MIRMPKVKTGVMGGVNIPTQEELLAMRESSYILRAEELPGARWQGPAGEGSFYEEPGTEIRGVERGARWLQYKATLVSLNGCRSPKLEEVRVDFER